MVYSSLRCAANDFMSLISCIEQDERFEGYQQVQALDACITRPQAMPRPTQEEYDVLFLAKIAGRKKAPPQAAIEVVVRARQPRNKGHKTTRTVSLRELF